MECILCKNKGDEAMLYCDGCDRPVHRECSELSQTELRVMDLKGKRSLKFYCNDCSEGIKLVPKLYKKIDSLFAEVESLKSQIQNNICNNEESILNELHERQKRTNNLNINNLPEPSASKESLSDTEVVKNIFKEITNKDVKIIQSIRIGKENKNGARSLKFILSDPTDVINIIKNRNKIGRDKRIYINQDLTYKQRENMKKLWNELKQQKEKGKNDIFIKYIRGIPKIVRNQKN